MWRWFHLSVLISVSSKEPAGDFWTNMWCYKNYSNITKCHVWRQNNSSSEIQRCEQHHGYDTSNMMLEVLSYLSGYAWTSMRAVRTRHMWTFQQDTDPKSIVLKSRLSAAENRGVSRNQSIIRLNKKETVPEGEDRGFCSWSSESGRSKDYFLQRNGKKSPLWENYF